MRRLTMISVFAFATMFSWTVVALANPKLGTQKRSGPIKYPDCYCTDSVGKRHEMGDVTCLTVGERSFEARCAMSQNNPIWRDLNRGCAAAALEAPMTAFPKKATF